MDEAAKFLRRYTADTAARLRAYAAVRGAGAVQILHADSREADPGAVDGILTSPPYPGLIDYHEQHRYAYELLGLEDRRGEEIGAAADGRSLRAQRAYIEAIAATLRRAAEAMPSGAPVVIVVNDSHDLYPRDPRRRRPHARAARHPPRQPAHGSPGGRVLRGRPGLPNG